MPRSGAWGLVYPCMMGTPVTLAPALGAFPSHTETPGPSMVKKGPSARARVRGWRSMVILISASGTVISRSSWVPALTSTIYLARELLFLLFGEHYNFPRTSN